VVRDDGVYVKRAGQVVAQWTVSGIDGEEG
jgi:hypothetical protein